MPAGQVPLGERCCRVKTFNQEDKNCSTVNYYQCGRATVLKCCMSELLVQLLDEPVFNALRTREQLGYDVTCQRRTTYNTLGFLISVSGVPGLTLAWPLRLKTPRHFHVILVSRDESLLLE